MITHSTPIRGLRPGDSLDDALRAWADEAHDASTCLLCDGETFTVRRRSGGLAVVCRSCGTSLEDDGPSAVATERRPPGGHTVLRVA